MLPTKLKAAVAVVLVLGVAATGTTVLTRGRAAGPGDPPPAAEKTAWGTAAGGLQAGLGVRPGERRAYHHGETVTLVVRVRNVGQKEATFEYAKGFFMAEPPAVTDDKGEAVPQVDLGSLVPPEQQKEFFRAKAREARPVREKVSLAPGKEVELYELKLKLGPGNKVDPETLLASGKVSIQYERLGPSMAAPVVDPMLSKLATGTVEFEVEPTPPAATGKK